MIRILVFLVVTQGFGLGNGWKEGKIVRMMVLHVEWWKMVIWMLVCDSRMSLTSSVER